MIQVAVNLPHNAQTTVVPVAVLKSHCGKLMTRRTDSDRIRARSETILRMPAWRRATFLSYAPQAQRGESDAARMASDIAAYRSVSVLA